MIDTGEAMCHGECCVVCKTVDTQTCTPETENTLCLN